MCGNLKNNKSRTRSARHKSSYGAPERRVSGSTLIDAHLHSLDVPPHLPTAEVSPQNPLTLNVARTYQSVTASSHSLTSCSLVPAK